MRRFWIFGLALFVAIACLMGSNVKAASDFDLNSIVFNDNESTAAMYVDKNELINMCNNGEIAYYLIDRIENEVSKYF